MTQSLSVRFHGHYYSENAIHIQRAQTGAQKDPLLMYRHLLANRETAAAGKPLRERMLFIQHF